MIGITFDMETHDVYRGTSAGAIENPSRLMGRYDTLDDAFDIDIDEDIEMGFLLTSMPWCAFTGNGSANGTFDFETDPEYLDGTKAQVWFVAG